MHRLCLLFLVLAAPVFASDTVEIQRQTLTSTEAAAQRDKVLIESLKSTVAQGDIAAQSGDQTTALVHYRQALAQLEADFLNISSYDIRFGIGIVAPRIAEAYAQSGDPRTLPAFKRLNLWSSCGLMASIGAKPYQDRLRALGIKRMPNPESSECARPLTFDLFRE